MRCLRSWIRTLHEQIPFLQGLGPTHVINSPNQSFWDVLFFLFSSQSCVKGDLEYVFLES